MNAKMTTTFADSTTFTSELQKTMEINQVTSISPSAISAGVSSSSSSSTSSLLSPSSAAGKVGGEKTSNDNVNGNNDEYDFLPLIFILGGVFICICIVCSFFYYYKHRQTKDVLQIFGDKEVRDASDTSDIEMISNPQKVNSNSQHKEIAELNAIGPQQQMKANPLQLRNAAAAAAASDAAATSLIVETNSRKRRDSRQRRNSFMEKRQLSTMQIVTDPKSGKRYSHNTETGETSWLDE
jgi:hypothetical protein